MRADRTSFENELGLLEDAPGLMKERPCDVEHGVDSDGPVDENPG